MKRLHLVHLSLTLTLSSQLSMRAPTHVCAHTVVIRLLRLEDEIILSEILPFFSKNDKHF